MLRPKAKGRDGLVARSYLWKLFYCRCGGDGIDFRFDFRSRNGSHFSKAVDGLVVAATFDVPHPCFGFASTWDHLHTTNHAARHRCGADGRFGQHAVTVGGR